MGKLMYIKKRDGRVVRFNKDRIYKSLSKANKNTNELSSKEIRGLTGIVCEKIKASGVEIPDVEFIQDIVESTLIENNYPKTAKEYILYRDMRHRVREMSMSLMKEYEKITFEDASNIDIKRENANVDGDSPMGIMLRYGSEGAKKFNLLYVIPTDIADAHKNGDIHIHDLDFYSITLTCCQIDLEKLFKGGFNTGHGYLREPSSIRSYSALACIAIQANQNDQHGGQSIPAIDYYLGYGVAKSFVKNVCKVLDVMYDYVNVNEIEKELKGYLSRNTRIMDEKGIKFIEDTILNLFHKKLDISDINRVIDKAISLTEDETYQAMEALVHNLNSMHSRAGAQVPFSSINYGTDTSVEGRMVIKNLLLATEAGLGNGETPIFPIQIFKLKDGINLKPEDPNYDLFKLACRVSAKRLYPNFSNIDAPYNLKYYKPNDVRTEVAYMGCRTRVLGNIYDSNNEVVTGRGNLSFTSINLPRLGLMAGRGNIDKFFKLLDERLDLVEKQLIHRFNIQSKRKVRNFPFLMGQGVWIGSDKLSIDDEIGEVIKHGTLSIGFIGLAETLIALTGKHHGEDKEAQELGLRIVRHIREFCDRKSEEYKLNFSCLATPAEGLAGRFVKLDRKLFGVVEGVTDKEYYTNSFHVPVYYKISAFKKIDIEAPYHELCNAGHITYIELDGDTSKNLEAFEKIVLYMHKKGIGYGAINHPVDRDPVCGYVGIIDDVCPRCGRREGEPMTIEMWYKIKGYTHNADNCGVCGDYNEEMDRVSNTIDEE
ncbi:MAG: anaerobic ribonucleoside triphosphate reductase [Candidatus Anstonellales archaeon]